MRKKYLDRLILFFKIILFWIIYFEIARLIFLFFNLSELKAFKLSEILLTFIHGFKLDISMIAYVLFFSMPFFLISCFFNSSKFLKLSLNIYTAILLLIFSLIIIADAEVYKYWGFRLDDTPLQYMDNPSAINSSITFGRLAFLVFLYFGIAIGSFLFFYFLITKKISNFKKAYFQIPIIIVFWALLFIPIRGGIGVAPLNAGAVYFSNNMFLNHAAINVVWNSGSALFAEPVDYNKFEYYNNSDLEKYYELAHFSESDSIKILNKKPKKIIFVILESFTANAVNIQDKEKSVTPKLHEWIKQGILFSNFYANGDRSEKGIVSILSAVPSMPSYSIMKNPKQTQKITSLVRSLKNIGYSSHFLYGGDINFSNMQSYLKNIGVEHIKCQNNLHLSCATTKWGYHDECMFELFANDIISDKDTAFYILFTLSSHEPYDIPLKGPYGDKSENQRCNNAYFYTDSCLNVFLTKIKKSKEWDNSLIVLVADHGTRYGNVEVWDRPMFNIFMHITGGVLSLENDFLLCDKTADQSDIAATLLGALNYKHDEFIFSEDIFSKKVTNAFYAYNHGFGFLKGTRWVIYDSNPQKFVYRGWDSEKLDTLSKAYIQKLSEYHKSLE